MGMGRWASVLPSLEVCPSDYLEGWPGLHSHLEKAELLGGMGFGWVASVGEKLDLWTGLGCRVPCWHCFWLIPCLQVLIKGAWFRSQRRHL